MTMASACAYVPQKGAGLCAGRGGRNAPLQAADAAAEPPVPSAAAFLHRAAMVRLSRALNAGRASG